MWNPNLTQKDRDRTRMFPNYLEWRAEVLKRDLYTCQCCGSTRNKLNAHHLKSYVDNKIERLEVDNGLTLCKECHTIFHNYYKRGKNTPEQYEEFRKRYLNGEFKQLNNNQDKEVV
jgi:5-methylcytosine-specific restriction endonuclease McrA